MKSSVTKPAAAVEQCQVKSRKSFLFCAILGQLLVQTLLFFLEFELNSHYWVQQIPFDYHLSLNTALHSL